MNNIAQGKVMANKIKLSRRQLIGCASSLLALRPLAVLANKSPIDIYVFKNAQCGCCDSWVEILSKNSFKVTTENLSRDLLTKFKIKNDVPDDMMSCYTAIIMDYFIEGHVPAEDIKRLITERPNALGLAVPGMPFGSPGMGPEAERESYDVFMIRKDGTPEVFKRYPKSGLLV